MRPPILHLAILVLMTASLSAQSAFVRVIDQHFEVDGKPYYFLGSNYWYGMHLAADVVGGDANRLIRELDQLQKLGINNLRVMVASEGPEDQPYRIQPSLQNQPGQYDERLLKGLDRLLAEMKARDMRAVLCLNNFFQWSGGMAQYVSWATQTTIPYPHQEGHTWTEFQNYSAQFFANKKAKKWFRRFITNIINRRNSLNGLLYKEDPTIMAWQLANEPRGFAKVRSYQRWVKKTAKYIHQIDPNHLVSLGGEGFLPYENIGTAFDKVSRYPAIDYLTIHLWVENWGWYQPQDQASYDSAMVKAIDYLNRHLPVAKNTDKPLVLEEFGMSRNGGDHHPNAATDMRDKYFNTIFEYIYTHAKSGNPIAGANFWSWSGEGKPPRPEDMWQLGDPLTGDPPHEKQGWYSIYSEDHQTLNLIKKYTELMNSLNENQPLSQQVGTN